MKIANRGVSRARVRALMVGVGLVTSGALPAGHAAVRPSAAAADSAQVVTAVGAMFAPRTPASPRHVSDSADFTTPDGTNVTGHDVAEQLQIAAEDHAVAMTATITRLTITGRKAVVEGRHVGTYTPQWAGADPIRLDERFNAVVVLESDGAWRVWQLVWDGPPLAARAPRRSQGVPPFLLPRAPRPSAIARAELARADAARNEQRRRDSTRKALGCTSDGIETGIYLSDTVFFSLVPISDADTVRRDLGAQALLEIVSWWKAPVPFIPPLVDTRVRIRNDAGARGFHLGLRFRLTADGRIQQLAAEWPSSWDALDQSVNAALAQADSADALAGVTRSDRGVELGLEVGLHRGSGLNVPALLVRNHVEAPLEPALPTTDTPRIRYPDELRARQVQGEVLMQFVVTAEGKVDPRTVVVLRSTHPAFVASVRQFLSTAVYHPARLGGCRVGTLAMQPFNFGMEGTARRSIADSAGGFLSDPRERWGNPRAAAPDVRRPNPDGSRPPH